jgi:hypothetical protein
MNMQVQEALEPKIGLTIKELHIILCLKWQDYKTKNIERCKIKVPNYFQRQTHQNFIKPLSWNHRSQKCMESYIFQAPRENKCQLGLYPGKLIWHLNPLT